MPDTERPRLEAEMREAVAIWQRVFPGETLDFAFWRGEDPRWSHPSVVEGRMEFRPEHLTRAFLGRLRVPGGRPGAPSRTVRLSIPRPPTAAELAAPELPPWAPAGREARLWRFSPLAWERRRHLAAVGAAAACRDRHDHRPLDLGLDGTLLPPPDPVPADRGLRPAVLIGFHWFEVGGAEELAFACVDWALAAGLRVFVVAQRPGLHRLAGRLPAHPDLRLLRPDRYLPHDRWPLWLEQLVRAENIRLIHIHHCVPLYAALAHLRATIPWVKVVDSTHIVEQADGGFPRISGVWTRYIDHHHVISRELAGYFADLFDAGDRVLPGRMLAVPADPPPPLRLAAGQPRLRLAFVGRMAAQKRPVLLALMLRALVRWGRRSGVAVEAAVVGDGPLGAAFDTVVARHGLGPCLRRLPAGADVAGLLGDSDLLLLPSQNEGLALVGIEALRAGCLPVATDVGAQAELLPPALRLPPEPRAALRAAVALVDRLWRDAEFLEAQKTALHAALARLAAEPAAATVLSRLYRDTAAGR